MSDATRVIIQQWGAFGAVLIVLGIVIWKLWTDATTTMKTTITTQAADIKALNEKLAESNAARQADHVTFSNTLMTMTRDHIAGLTNASNAIEAATEEMRHRRGG